MSRIKKIFNNTLSFYLLVGIFLFFTVDYKRVAQHAWPKTLSRLRTEYSFLIDASNGAPINKESFIDGKRYFNAILSIYGMMTDVHAFLGMSEYYLGNHLSAKNHFLKLRAAAPGFFWANYNLALLSYLDKDFSSAATFCQEALTYPMEASVTFMMRSKVYQPLFVENGFTPEKLAADIDQGRMVMVRLLMAMKAGSAVSFDKTAPIRIF